jgi:sugar phosphate isomerase/epimerase
MKPAFSTVACPEWTFPQLVQHAERWGFLGCELRTFGYGSTQFSCDPALTSPAKLRLLLERAGIEVVSLATSIRYDEPITPPILGNVLSDTEKSVRETKGAIDLAVRMECPYVRVFGFEIVGHEPRKSAIARIASRLGKAADHARNSGVKLLIENGGSFATSAQLAELMDAVGNPLLEAAYSLPVAALAGEKPEDGINVLSDRLACVKVRDFKGHQPCALGEGEMDTRGGIAALARAGFKGWVVYEYDRAWIKPDPENPPPPLDEVMKQSAMRLFEWIERGRGLSKRPDVERVTGASNP